MQQRSKTFSICVLLAIAGLSVFLLGNPAQVEAAAGLRIATPTVPDSGLIVTYESIIEASGTVQGLSKGVILKSIACTTDQGNTGIATITAYAYVGGGDNPTYGTFSWTAQAQLVAGGNMITITAVDGNDNTYTESFQVYYIPYSVTGTQEFLMDYRSKAKFTFYYTAKAGYTNVDRFSVTGYLAKAKTDPWCLPFSQDVTVSVSAHVGQTGEEILLFTQKIPKNKVSGTSRYRYLSRTAGIQEMVFEKSKYTDTYFYVFVDKVNLLASQRASMSSADYWAFIKSIDSFTITVQPGTSEWAGTAPLTRGTYSTVKQEMVFNR
ncbi:MAG: hypothetical protein LLG06_04370 [Desulfobacteraceae bacterium]|nr:hypothetical protein [Desulfobacteraceae bacterium]